MFDVCFSFTDYSSERNMTTSVQTYHCICTNLVLATTFPLNNHRQLDRSIILPNPSLSPRQEAALIGDETNSSVEDNHVPELHTITQLVGTSARDSQTLIIRSDEGIEKRYLIQCSRCKVTLGYQLDWDQFTTQGEASVSTRNGRRDDVVYLLEGAVITTEAMKA